MILLRLSPLIPYNALDYISGVTAIPLQDYSLALIGILPGTIMLCFVGASASSLADSAQSGNETVRILSIVFGVTFAVIGVSVASYYSKLELDKVSIVLHYAVNFASYQSNASLTLSIQILASEAMEEGLAALQGDFADCLDTSDHENETEGVPYNTTGNDPSPIV
jgi:hypothetical protein